MAKRSSILLREQARALEIQHFKIAAQQLAVGLYQGQHRALRKGSGIEFAGHRAYTPGDDLRRLDHHARAKFDRLLVREFQSETDRAAHFIIDTSASMHYAGDGEKKLNRALLMAAALGLLLRKQGDSIGLTLWGSKEIGFLPSSNEQVSERFLNQLADCLSVELPQSTPNPLGLQASQRLLAERLPRGTLTFFLSDCLDPISDTLKILAPLQTKGRNVFVLQTLNSHEVEFPFSAPAYFVDPEVGTSTLSDPQQVQRVYQTRFKAYQKSLRSALAQCAIRLFSDHGTESTKAGLQEILRKLTGAH